MNKKNRELLFSTSNENGELDRYLSTLDFRKRTVNWLCSHDSSLSKWKMTLIRLALAEIERKKKDQIPDDEEKEILENVASFFNRLSYLTDKLHEWNEELDEDRKEMEEMINQFEP
jgi:hypothetical protein